MSEHPCKVPYYPGTLKQLANAVEDLEYDKLVEFLDALNLALVKRSVSDKIAGRKKLSWWLRHAGKQIESASFCIEEAWKICKKHKGK